MSMIPKLEGLLDNTTVAGTDLLLLESSGVSEKRTAQETADGLSNLAVGSYGEFYVYEKAIPFDITVANTYHGFHEILANDVSVGANAGFTVIDGRRVDTNITSEADSGGLLRIVCSAAHGLSTGDLVVIGKANNAGHNKPTFVFIDGTNPTTEFICSQIAYVAGAGASAATVNEPTQIVAETNTSGKFLAILTIDGTASNINKAWKWELNIGVLPYDNVVTERNSTNTLASMTASGILTIAAWDRVWVSGKNSTDTTDYTVKNMNLSLVKIGV